MLDDAAVVLHTLLPRRGGIEAPTAETETLDMDVSWCRYPYETRCRRRLACPLQLPVALICFTGPTPVEGNRFTGAARHPAPAMNGHRLCDFNLGVHQNSILRSLPTRKGQQSRPCRPTPFNNRNKLSRFRLHLTLHRNSPRSSTGALAGIPRTGGHHRHRCCPHSTAHPRKIGAPLLMVVPVPPPP